MTAREELAAIPTQQQVKDVAHVLMRQWEIVEGKSLLAPPFATFTDMAWALLSSPVLARVIREREFGAIRAANLRAIKHELETPSRGHGECCGQTEEF